MNNTHRLISFSLGILFILFSVVQFNDPDPAVWISIYGMAAFIAFSAFKRKLYPNLTFIALVVYFIGFVGMWPDQYYGVSLSMEYRIEIEEARESLGLLISAATMRYFLFLAKKHKQDYEKSLMYKLIRK